MIEPDTLSRAPLPASPDEPAPLTSPMVTNLGQAARAMLAKPKPADATPMSAEKAKAIVIDKNKRELAKIQAAYQARKKARMAPTMFIIAHGIRTDAMAATNL